MTLSDWIFVGGALLAGLFIGYALSTLVKSLLGKETRPEPLQQAAKPIASFVFALFTVLGLITALSKLQPEAVEELSSDAIAFIPKALVAGIILIASNVLSTFAETALNTATARMSINMQQKARLILKGTITTVAALLAVQQLGINTDIINMGVAAIFFSLAGAFVLLVGVGGLTVAKHVASGRAVKRLVSVGDRVTIDSTYGSVAAIHPTYIEVTGIDGKAVLIPSSQFLEQPIKIERQK